MFSSDSKAFAMEGIIKALTVTAQKPLTSTPTEAWSRGVEFKGHQSQCEEVLAMGLWEVIRPLLTLVFHHPTDTNA